MTGRCDSHVHVVGPVERYPQLPNRSGIMGVADVAALRGLGAAHGISRFVIVQPSFYGTDNSMLLDALKELNGHGRGVIVDDGLTLPDILDSWKDVCGMRLNIYSPIGRPKNFRDTFTNVTGSAEMLNWHVEVIASLPQLLEHADLIAWAAPVPIVLDHYGVYGSVRPDSDEGRRLLALLKSQHVWMKLSAPYRVSANPNEIKPDPEWLGALLDAAPDRCVWGSDWPHTPAHEATTPGYRPIGYGALVDAFLAAIGDAALTERIMTHNPARLYGFV